MMLRTRLSMVVTLVFTVVVAGMTVLIAELEQGAERRLAANLGATYRVLWANMIKAERAALEDAVDDIVAAHGEDLDAALRQHDQRSLSTLLSAAARRLADKGAADRVEAVSPTGALLFSSQSSLVSNPALDADSVDDIPAAPATFSTLTRDASEQPVQVAARRIGTAGALVVVKKIDGVLGQISAAAGGDTLLVSRYGRCLLGACTGAWTDLAGHPDFRLGREVQAVRLGERVFAAVSTTLPHMVGRIGARLYVVKDVTEHSRRQSRTLQLSLIAAALALGLIVAWLWWYVRGALRPVEATIASLDALARGDVTTCVVGAPRNDEVGAITRAVEAFRDNLLTVIRLKRSREKQRRRQERFIHHEMQRLAGALDEETRSSILADLAAIGTASAASTDAVEANGLGMIVPALQRLSELVRDQNDRLRTLVEELTEALKTKTAYIAMQHDLEIARDIQAHMIPSVFPPYPERSDFDLHAIMEPAKAVGGDLYDFFLIDHDRLFFMVGDVSDKGVPSALFMAIVRTLFRNIASADLGIAEVSRRVNDYLVANNISQMFVTVFACILDLRNGTVCYVDGGHEPPVLTRADGSVEVLKKQGGMAMGFVPFDYESRELQLAPGDGILLYSDGVNEAMNEARQMFKLDRLLDVVAQAGPTADARSVATELVRQVHLHAGETPQSDDITVLVLRYLGAPAPC